VSGILWFSLPVIMALLIILLGQIRSLRCRINSVEENLSARMDIKERLEEIDPRSRL
jgi:hypothetical protein